MAELDKTAPVAASTIQRRTTEADTIVALAQQTGGNPARTIDFDGVRVKSDRVAVAAGARFGQQLAELRQSAANAATAASLLDVADAGFTKIETKLSRLGELATQAALTDVERSDGSTYTPSEISSQDRAILNSEFSDLVGEIDSVASSTAFSSIELLSGDPDSAGDPLELSFRTGGTADKSVTVSIADTRAEALSASLPTADLLSAASATGAKAAVEEAQVALSDRQAAVRGARAQLNSVETAAGEVSAVVENVREMRTSPETVVDLSRLLAHQVTDEGGVNLSEGAQKLLQDVLLRMSASTANGGPAVGGDAAEEFGGKTSGAPAAAAPAFADNAQSTDNAA